MVDDWSTAECALLKHFVQQGWGPEAIRQEFAKEGIKRNYGSIRGKIRRERDTNPLEWREHIAAPPDCARRFDQ